jgi:hypothetical protein
VPPVACLSSEHGVSRRSLDRNARVLPRDLVSLPGDPSPNRAMPSPTGSLANRHFDILAWSMPSRAAAPTAVLEEDPTPSTIQNVPVHAGLLLLGSPLNCAGDVGWKVP